MYNKLKNSNILTTNVKICCSTNETSNVVVKASENYIVTLPHGFGDGN